MMPSPRTAKSRVAPIEAAAHRRPIGNVTVHSCHVAFRGGGYGGYLLAPSHNMPSSRGIDRFGKYSAQLSRPLVANRLAGPSLRPAASDAALKAGPRCLASRPVSVPPTGPGWAARALRAGNAVYGCGRGAAEEDCACAQGFYCLRRPDEIDDAPDLTVPNLTVTATGHPLCRPRSARRSESCSSVAPFDKMNESARSSNTAVTRFSLKRRS